LEEARVVAAGDRGCGDGVGRPGGVCDEPRNDLEWLVGSSLPRLLVQIWPLALLAFFLALGEEPAPEMVPAAVAKKPEGKRGKQR
jgi:hypothetical protein